MLLQSFQSVSRLIPASAQAMPRRHTTRKAKGRPVLKKRPRKEDEAEGEEGATLLQDFHAWGKRLEKKKLA